MNFKYLLIYLLLINIISALVCAMDKILAKKRMRRISEKTLFGLSLFGGAIAMYATMRYVRHKTLHKRFMIGLPIIIALQLIILFFIYKNNLTF